MQTTFNTYVFCFNRGVEVGAAADFAVRFKTGVASVFTIATPASFVFYSIKETTRELHFHQNDEYHTQFPFLTVDCPGIPLPSPA